MAPVVAAAFGGLFGAALAADPAPVRPVMNNQPNTPPTMRTMRAISTATAIPMIAPMPRPENT